MATNNLSLLRKGRPFIMRGVVIRQENPSRKWKMVFLSPLPHHAGQALEFRLPEPHSVRQQSASDEEESVGHGQAAQAGHDAALYA
jgi:hypothetical protein